MTIIKLFICCLTIFFGMLFLPPLSGVGLGSLVTRSWLGLGLLIFFGNYLQFIKEEDANRRQQVHQIKVHPLYPRIRGYSSARK